MPLPQEAIVLRRSKPTVKGRHSAAASEEREREKWLRRLAPWIQWEIDGVSALRRRDERERRRGMAMAALTAEIHDVIGNREEARTDWERALLVGRRYVANRLMTLAGPAAMAWARNRGNK